MIVWNFIDTFVKNQEHWWLLIVLAAELHYSIKIHKMAKIEFEYDKAYNERMEAREARRNARKKERMQPLDKEMD